MRSSKSPKEAPPTPAGSANAARTTGGRSRGPNDGFDAGVDIGDERGGTPTAKPTEWERLVAHRLDLGLALALLAFGAFFLPWHEFHELSLGGLFLGPDGHNGSVGSTTGTVCSGFSHDKTTGIPLALLLAVRVALAFAARKHPRLAIFMTELVVGMAVLFVAAIVHMMPHMLDRVRYFFGQTAFFVLFGVLVVADAARLLYRLGKFIWLRSRRQNA